MKAAFLFLMTMIFVSVTWAGGTGSGSTGGTRPTMNSLESMKSVDAVKFRNFNKGKVEFYFKDRNIPKAELYEVKLEEIDNKYIEALQKSAESKSWQPVFPEKD
nr:hypothetical protein BdHM001_00860 [Bdellovibrio sp. HM001]BFD65065.1 hypothetical protein HAGR004_00870 [Bdellovibrio sp. HAGR004]